MFFFVNSFYLFIIVFFFFFIAFLILCFVLLSIFDMQFADIKLGPTEKGSRPLWPMSANSLLAFPREMSCEEKVPGCDKERNNVQTTTDKPRGIAAKSLNKIPIEHNW